MKMKMSEIAFHETNDLHMQVHIYDISPLLRFGSRPLKHVTVGLCHIYVLACASRWSCKMDYVSLRGLSNFKMRDNASAGSNSMLKYVHGGYIYKCKCIYIYSEGFNSTHSANDAQCSNRIGKKD
jgi:hypothetical protein